MGLFQMASASRNYFGWSRSATRPVILLAPGKSWEEWSQEGKGCGASRPGLPIPFSSQLVMTQYKAHPFQVVRAHSELGRC